MSTSAHYDVIIIGSGAGGGTLAHALAPTGLRILVLERGDFLPRERDNWDARAVFVDGKYGPGEHWYDARDKPFEPGQHYNVGGNTKFYGGALLRFRAEDFGEVHHHDGVSPAWPLSYTDYRPYYLAAEKLYHVHGQRGIDPTEPPEDAPFPYAPLVHEPRIQRLHDDLTSLGHHPFPLPMAVDLREDSGIEEAPYVIENFDGFPDPTELKADAHVVAVRPALLHDNVTLLRNRYVEKLVADRRTVKEVVVRHGEEVETYRGDVVVVACGAVNSAALLLRSANDAHPNGLANRSDVVGRHYMAHNNTAMVALSIEPNPTRFGKTLGLNDFYFRSDEYDHPLGHIQMLGKSRPEMFEGEAPSFVPGFTLELLAQHALDFWLTTEDLPHPDNRVTLRDDGTIKLSYRENNLEAHRRLQATLRGMLKDIGCDNRLVPCSYYLGKKIPLAGVAHQCGTVRFGTNPETSALDTTCKAHDLDNLYVVDGSFFVSSTSVNPGLTIMANALRVADHLKERLHA